MGFSLAAFLALLWPFYALFGGIEPRLAGLPMSLAYLIIVIVVVFSVMMALFLWENRHDRLG